MTFTTTTKYGTYPGCSIRKRFYGNGAPAWEIIDDCGVVACATVNLDMIPPEGYLYIKNWSENEGVLPSLIEAGLVRDTGTRAPTGYVEAALVEIL